MSAALLVKVHRHNKTSILNFMTMPLYLLLDIPDESAETEFGALGVELAQAVEEWRHTVVFSHHEYGGCKRGPCVAAVVGLAVDASAPRHLPPGREAAAVGALKRLHDVFVMCLVKGYEY